jgi:hypothetical protein
MSARKLQRYGKSVSTPGEARSKSDRTPRPELEELLRKVFDRYRGADKLLHRREYRRDFVFHMTDWLGDLRELNDLYDHPENYTKDESCAVIYRFFMHAMSHLKAAERILFDRDEQCDPFAALYQPEDQKVSCD